MGKIEAVLILGAIIMVLFGAKQLPKTARSVGEAVNELKKGLSDNPLTSPTLSEATYTEAPDVTQEDLQGGQR